MSLVSLVVLACSGPGAATLIQRNISIGHFCAAIGGIITLALGFDAWRTSRWKFAFPVATVMLLMHPAWTVSAIHGDCGLFKRDASYFFTAIYFGLLIYQSLVNRWPKAKPAVIQRSEDSSIRAALAKAILRLDANLIEEVNPYQSPLPFDPSPECSSHSATSCPQCNARVTFWAGLKQFSPFRFKCPHCRTMFKVVIPFKWIVLLTVCLIFGLLTLASCAGVAYFGVSSLRLTAPILIGSWMILELGWHRYVTRRGRFARFSPGGETASNG